MRTLLLLLVTGFYSLTYAQSNLNLVPWPVDVKQPSVSGNFTLKATTTYSSNFPEEKKDRLFQYLQLELKKRNIKLVKVNAGANADIRFEMYRMPSSGKPAYNLSVDMDGIRIRSNFHEPAFNAIQTLLQLLPVEYSAKQTAPFIEIYDYARFDYRGMHFDVARHFEPVTFVKKYIDYLAYHKLNKFHWHLTDDQGWRIPVKKYPELTKTGGWRNGTIIGRYPGTGSDNIYYGGSYTPDEIKEIVEYARDRFIDVIPEIEMPGHGSAAIAAYPWLSCFPQKPTPLSDNMISAKSKEQQKNGRIKLVQETWGVFDDVFCAGNDSTFMFLENVMDEIIPLFPSKYVHIGGDECPKTHWKICPRCQQRMKELNLKDEHELQSYFIQRIEKYLNSKGKTIVGWDEILEGGLAPNAIVMSWQGEKGGIEAAKQNHDVIMTPGNPVYFDHTQSEQEDSVTIGGYNPIEKVYAYEPIPKELNAEQGKHILGAQANLWTEYIKNPKKVEYMIFPRMSALSEVLWSPKEARNWESFEKRLPAQFIRYAQWGANYSKAFYDIKATLAPSPEFEGVMLKLDTKKKNDPVFLYKEAWIEGHPISDKKDPKKITDDVTHGMGIKIGEYTGPIKLTESSSYGVAYQSAIHKKNGLPYPGFDLLFNLRFNKATGKKISLKEEAASNYPGDGAFTLVNGIINTKGFARTKEFLGWSGKDAEAIIDLGITIRIDSVTVHSLDRRSSWIYRPGSVEVLVSNDGQNFRSVNQSGEFFLSDAKTFNGYTRLIFPPVDTRYVKIIAKNWGKIPEGQPGAGRQAWLFLDEIEVH